ncbi:MAG: CcoQ/FixQ family Cbb3-type cytochrome c oxidase assembly chaperone [Candidatus Sericytochromatia bacterium]
MEFETIVGFSKQFTTILFFTFFMGVTYWAYNKENKYALEEVKYSIFDEDEIRRLKNGQ